MLLNKYMCMLSEIFVIKYGEDFNDFFFTFHLQISLFLKNKCIEIAE